MDAHAVLLVEDDEYQREPMTLLFELEGYAVTIAADGAAALDMLRAGLRPCIIVFDISIPGMCGEDFRREQMDDDALGEIPVILYSSGWDLSASARLLGIAAHAPKPDAEKLLKLIAQYC